MTQENLAYSRLSVSIVKWKCKKGERKKNVGGLGEGEEREPVFLHFSFCSPGLTLLYQARAWDKLKKTPHCDSVMLVSLKHGSKSLPVYNLPLLELIL